MHPVVSEFAASDHALEPPAALAVAARLAALQRSEVSACSSDSICPFDTVSSVTFNRQARTVSSVTFNR